MDARKTFTLCQCSILVPKQPNTAHSLKIETFPIFHSRVQYLQILKCINEMGHNIILKNQATTDMFTIRKIERKHSCGLVTFSKLGIIFF